MTTMSILFYIADKNRPIIITKMYFCRSKVPPFAFQASEGRQGYGLEAYAFGGNRFEVGGLRPEHSDFQPQPLTYYL